MNWILMGLGFCGGIAFALLYDRAIVMRVMLSRHCLIDKLECALSDLHFAQRDRDKARAEVDRLSGELAVERKLAQAVYGDLIANPAPQEWGSLDKWRECIAKGIPCYTLNVNCKDCATQNCGLGEQAGNFRVKPDGCPKYTQVGAEGRES